ncbi:MAG: SDR family oxidoreductase [Actinomycetota bacterium]|nr:SDR family oxidoreductase [Actinomycetota bacterium]MDK1015878.1 SDR family oxidoreductase [Actinomycetota bacterium]MDK1025786.1 SDR family oxidoreductase [Actinomycetota bacterium]MDK1037405.1 SDR family oxidoreductase [Actinomycetota bacterium]MDK1096607.1 SDR family oxidoreductase [Actinomycetota bacterium]
MEIEGRIAVITGGGSGIGAAMARRFAVEGAKKVIIVDLDGDAAHYVASDIDGGAFTLDVTDEQATIDVLTQVEREHGRIDILCLNAGIPTDGSVDASNEDWQRTWDVNVMAHVYATRHTLPGMLARGEGYIVTTASAAGLLTNVGAAPYSVTKHAAVALAEWLSVTYGSRGIGVSCLCPMFVDTPMLDAFAGHTDEMRGWVESLAIDVDDVAEAVVEAIRSESFLILPHPIVLDYFQRKALDYDRWIRGMQDLSDRLTTP